MIEPLIEALCREKGEILPKHLSKKEEEDYFRSLCNTRPPLPVSDDFLQRQDRYLTMKSQERGIVDVTRLEYKGAIALWQGDITRLNSEAIVNACKPSLLGCYHPLHNCIDNVIHSNAGVQVRRDCHRIMQGKELPTGDVEVTPAYNLPSRYIFHTVGPSVKNRRLCDQYEADLARCYRSCVGKASELGLETVAFCCISTGVYGYPKDLAAKVAVETAREVLPGAKGVKIIFNVFLGEDKVHYERELSR